MTFKLTHVIFSVIAVAMLCLIAVQGGEASTDVFCVECEYIIAQLQKDLENETDVSVIVKEIQKEVCAKLPSLPEKESCKLLVSKLSKVMEEVDVDWIDNYTPRATCGLLELCTFECCEMPYMPEQIHLSLTDAPTEMVVMWVTNIKTAQSDVFEILFYGNVTSLPRSTKN